MKLRAKSIATKLTWMNLLVSGTALLLACAGFLAYDQITYRQSLVRNLSAQAQIIGYNSIAALTFNDPQSTRNTLSALGSSPNIVNAGILTPDGRVFAQYSRSPSDQVFTIPAIPEGRTETYSFGSKHVILVRSIIFQSKPTAMVYIRSDLADMTRRLERYAIIAAIVLIISLLGSVLLSSGFRRSVAAPVLSLAETARVVSRDKNYAVRATPTGDHDEVDLLVNSFNEMLAQIEQRDDALRTAHADLEQRVEERTRQLSVANKELETFSYSVSHDLRAPLEVINGFSYVLETEYRNKLDATGRECLSHIRNATSRMAELIEDMLNLSRVSTTAMHRDSVDLTAIAQTIATDLCRREPERHVEFTIAQHATTQGDARFLQIVLENLLRNAWKYTSHHKRAHIEFGVENRRRETVYFVRDDGAGFDPKQANRLFQPFQRLHSESEFSGNGIGLATVQRIIQRHSGHIWATGEVDKGATFYFTIGGNVISAPRPLSA